MKLYRNLAIAVVDGLGEILNGNRHADKVVEKILKQDPRWGSRDRKFVAETIYDIIRWKRLFETCAGTGHWQLFACGLIRHNIEIPSWPELDDCDAHKIKEKLAETHNRAVRESIPDWIDDVGEQAFGEQWGKELSALNEPAPVTLRCNTLKVTREELANALHDEGVETIAYDDFPFALQLKKRGNVFRTQAFKDGLFEVQDAGSQAIAPFCRADAGMRIIDACAGGGGKALHLAAITGNKGRIIALDTEDWKLQELKKRARRAGVSTIETRVITDRKVIKRLQGQADRLLLDVPCSGLGVLKRNPDAKWKLTPESVAGTIRLQEEILNEYQLMLKPGGEMVYATCSILPQENENQIRRFIELNKEFELLEEKHLLPSGGTDGFYMARLRKNTN
ncbi:MAG: RsmB/NOP family class I SAM-dependent RNA methyltransferase [Cyclobacteriaceae bacterium]